MSTNYKKDIIIRNGKQDFCRVLLIYLILNYLIMLNLFDK